MIDWKEREKEIIRLCVENFTVAGINFIVNKIISQEKEMIRDLQKKGKMRDYKAEIKNSKIQNELEKEWFKKTRTTSFCPGDGYDFCDFLLNKFIEARQEIEELKSEEKWFDRMENASRWPFGQ